MRDRLADLETSSGTAVPPVSPQRERGAVSDVSRHLAGVLVRQGNNNTDFYNRLREGAPFSAVARDALSEYHAITGTDPHHEVANPLPTAAEVRTSLERIRELASSGTAVPPVPRREIDRMTRRHMERIRLEEEAQMLVFNASSAEARDDLSAHHASTSSMDSPPANPRGSRYIRDMRLRWEQARRDSVAVQESVGTVIPPVRNVAPSHSATFA